jgi:hypothetical protein
MGAANRLNGRYTALPYIEMNAGSELPSPLVPRCIELLSLARVLWAGSEFFPGSSNEKPMSNMVLLMTMRRMRSGYTCTAYRIRGLGSVINFVATEI